MSARATPTGQAENGNPTFKLESASVGSQASGAQYLIANAALPVNLVGPAARLHHLFEKRCDQFGFRGSRSNTAVEYPDREFSYRALDQLANRIARYLLARGVSAGDRVALLFDRSIFSYAGILAVSKVGGVYVPLDPSFPADRIAYICNDSGASLALTVAQYKQLFHESAVNSIALDAHEAEIQRMSSRRPRLQTDPAGLDATCYIIYTSGSTGNPKGVAVTHRNICSFLQVAVANYGYLETDRVYQGMTIAFDYSNEEIWVPLLCGATLVPAQSGVNLLGQDVADFITDRNISAMCCVPTLLETVDAELPGLRFLMVSGEACPQDLADKWCRNGRRFLNTYGPTEATVTATWSVMKSGQKVSIGGPLPGYSIVILDPDQNTVLPIGQAGEIAIAGVGIAQGYVNLPEQTEQAFIPDFIGMPNNPGGRIYRTGDLGRINDKHKIDYLGRIDTQVKIRGYRIELDEIASVARTVSGVGQVAVNAFESEPGTVELVAYFTNLDPTQPVEPDAIYGELKDRLPSYMVPAFIECIERMPLLPSTKVDRKALPAPSGPRFMMSGKGYRAPESELQQALAEQLTRLMKLDRVSVDADFFDELGANSLLMARYLSAIRKSLGIKKMSMRTIYQHPNIIELASALGDVPESSPEPTSIEGIESGPTPSSSACEREKSDQDTTLAKGLASGDRDPHHVASPLAYWLCGIAQLGYLTLGAIVGLWMLLAALRWIVGAEGVLELYTRSAIAGTGLFLAAAIGLIAIKWIAIGQFRRERIPLWSFRYYRFWVARTAIAANPLNLFLGTPVYNWYLRSLGAHIGPRAVLFNRPPICADLIWIGADTLIRQDVLLQGYTARDGFIYCGAVQIGSRSLICEATVIEINTKIGDDTQLGTSSALLENGQLPSGEIYQGSPAEKSTTRFDRVAAGKLPAWQPKLYTLGQLLNLCLFSLPIPMLIAAYAWKEFLANRTSEISDMASAELLQALPYLALASATAYLGSLLLMQLSVVTLPRVINIFIRENETHRLYGIQFFLTRLLTRTSHSRALSHIYGDSSLITHFLSAVGYDLSESTQTGSNFGVVQLHHSPFMIKFCRNTLVSDGLTMLNFEPTSTTFKMKSVTVQPDNYLGNLLHWPSDTKVGENCLIGTKAMVPIDGPVRTGVGILGSPPFEIPRSVVSDHQFDHFKEPTVLRINLWRKLRSNLLTIAFYMTRIWSQVFLVLITLFLLTEPIVSSFANSTLIPAAMLGLLTMATIVAIPLYIIAFERLFLWKHPMRPLYCSLYDNRFWVHERFWKLNYNDLVRVFSGTPLKPLYSKLQGAKIGKQVFDDGAILTEPKLAQVGDHSCLNNLACIQSHSLEDGTFKSDYSRVGARCTIGVRGFVHYGTDIKDNALIQSDSFVMKGSVVETGDVWLGNPARDSQSLRQHSESAPLPIDEAQMPVDKAA